MRLSDDGQWWWDGGHWIAVTEVVLPQLSTTEFERSGKLAQARARMSRRNRASEMLVVDSAVPTSSPLALIGLALAVPFLVVERRAFRDYRTWTLEQLALATACILGPNEPMLAGETELRRGFFGGPVTRSLTIVATAAHVLIFRIDSLDGQPRWLSMAARTPDVKLEAHNMRFGAQPSLMIRRGAEQWWIRGYPRVFNPAPLLDVWRRSAFPG